jgi:pimeloyl-ACP methyl ester carboxylesterase
VGPLAAAGWKAVAIDLPGCGWSDGSTRGYRKQVLADHVAATLDELGIDSFDVAGHDWGGWTAQLLALGHPDRVRRVTMLGIAPLWTPRSVMALHLWRFGYQPLVALPAVGPAAQRTRWFWALMQRQGIDADAAAVYRSTYATPESSEAGSRFYRDFLLHEVPELLRGALDDRSITSPVTAVLGRRDPVIRRAMLSELHAHVTELDVIELDCGHFLVDERPDLVTGLLLDAHGRPG